MARGVDGVADDLGDSALELLGAEVAAPRLPPRSFC